MKKEEILDQILKKFEGNKSFTWDEIHQNEFYQSIDNDYFVVENHLNFLIGDGSIEEVNVEPGFLTLTRKGWFKMTNPSTDGYVTLRKKEKQEKWLKIALAIVSLITFCLVAIRFIFDYFKN